MNRRGSFHISVSVIPKKNDETIKEARIVERITNLFAFEHPNTKEYRNYMKNHPKADPHKHWVKQRRWKHKRKDYVEEKSDTAEPPKTAPTKNDDNDAGERRTQTPWSKHPKDKIEKVLASNPKKRQKLNLLTANVVFFDTTEDGKSVFKPTILSESTVENLRDNETYNPDVDMAHREELAYKLDVLIGMNMVPPTKVVTKHIKRTKIDDEEVDEGDYEGSSQMFLEGATTFFRAIRRLKDFYKDADSGVRKQIQRLALFDEMIGNTDRHEGNIMLSKDKKTVFAIDNGLIASNEKVSTDDLYAYNVPCDVVDNNFDDDVLDEFSRINKTKFFDLMESYGLSREAKASWNRLTKIVGKDRIERNKKQARISMVVFLGANYVYR